MVISSFRVVEMLRTGLHPVAAVQSMLKTINQVYPGFSGAMVAVNKNGTYGEIIRICVEIH